jgi:hypothetical protein
MRYLVARGANSQAELEHIVEVAKEILSWDPSRLPNEESSFDSSARFLLEAKQKKLASP